MLVLCLCLWYELYYAGTVFLVRKLDARSRGSMTGHTVARMNLTIDPIQATLTYGGDPYNRNASILAFKWLSLGLQFPLDRETLCQGLALILRRIAPFYKAE